MQGDLAAPMDNVTRGLTALVFILVPGAAIVMVFMPPPGNWIGMIGVGIALVALAVVYLYRPTGYTRQDDALHLHRPIGAVVIPREEVVAARRLEQGRWKYLRAMGSGGFYGYYGKFWSKETGLVDFHVTSLRAPLVLIETRAGKKRVISPDPVWVDELMGWLPAGRD